MNIFKQFLKAWKHDKKHQPHIFWLELTGTITSMLASFLLASFAINPPMFVIFSLWLYGAISMSTAFYFRRNGSAMLLMLWYVGINILGLSNILIDTFF